MASRLVEKKRLRWTPEARVSAEASFLDVPGGDPGKMFERFEYQATLNGGEFIRCVLNDPFSTMINPSVGQSPAGKNSYYNTSRKNAPINIKTNIEWIKSVNNDLKTPFMNHVLVGLAPYGEVDTGSVEFIAIDYASWYLNGGDAGGYRYKGNIKQVITEVINKYSRGALSVDFRTETNDSMENQWWQNRQDPKSFILSLLDWSPSISRQQTQWFVYPDDEESTGRVIITEQADVQSVPRATYYFKGHKGPSRGQLLPNNNQSVGSGHGDIIEWEMIGDNALQMVRHKIATNGISAVSGAYFDRRNPGDGQTVLVGDTHTPNKYKPKANEDNAFSKPEADANPLDGMVGWTTLPAIPEFSAGDMGLRYDEYMDGRARHWYLRLNNALMRCRFKIQGHHIWAGSEGLGADTINIVARTPNDKVHFVSGKWIVYGYHHVVDGDGWTTDLYCSKLDHDAAAKQV